MTASTSHGQPHAGQRRTLAALMVVVPLGFMVCFSVLGATFEYPDILRSPAAEVLTRFHADRDRLGVLWYGMFACAVLFIPLAVLLPRHMPSGAEHRHGLLIAGVLAGLVQSIGLSRWVFVVPELAAAHAGGVAGDAPLVAFDVLNRLLGVGIGEHLGYLFTGAWTLLLCARIRGSRPIIALIGAVCAGAILAGLLEPAGVAWAGAANAIGYSAWSLWLVWLGVLVWMGRLVPGVLG
jgi:hypothetical protein